MTVSLSPAIKLANMDRTKSATMGALPNIVSFSKPTIHRERSATMGVLPSMSGDTKLPLPGGAIIRNTFIEFKENDMGENRSTLRRQLSDSALERPNLRSELVAEVEGENEVSDSFSDQSEDDHESVVSVESGEAAPSLVPGMNIPNRPAVSVADRPPVSAAPLAPPSAVRSQPQVAFPNPVPAAAKDVAVESTNFNSESQERPRRVSWQQDDIVAQLAYIQPTFPSSSMSPEDEVPRPNDGAEEKVAGKTAPTTRIPVPLEDEAMMAVRNVIEQGGLNGATTLMARHIPSKYTQQNLMREINAVGFVGTYDFFYLPMHPQCRGNRGFVFINFCTPEAAEVFYAVFHGKKLKSFQSPRPVSVRIADMQGFEANAEHYLSLRNCGRCSEQNGNALFLRPFPPHLAAAAEAAQQVSGKIAASVEEATQKSSEQAVPMPQLAQARAQLNAQPLQTYLQQQQQQQQQHQHQQQQQQQQQHSGYDMQSPLEQDATGKGVGSRQMSGGSVSSYPSAMPARHLPQAPAQPSTNFGMNTDGMLPMGMRTLEPNFRMQNQVPMNLANNAPDNRMQMGAPMGLDDAPPGIMASHMEDGTQNAARSIASVMARRPTDPIGALAALLAAPKGTPNHLDSQPQHLMETQGNPFSTLNSVLESTNLHQASLQGSGLQAGLQPPVGLPLPRNMQPQAVAPQMPTQLSTDEEERRFCVYCGKRRAPDHLFCAYCGRRSSEVPGA